MQKTKTGQEKGKYWERKRLEIALKNRPARREII